MNENTLLNIVVDLIEALIEFGEDLETIRYILEGNGLDERAVDTLLRNYEQGFISKNAR